MCRARPSWAATSARNQPLESTTYDGPLQAPLTSSPWKTSQYRPAGSDVCQYRPVAADGSSLITREPAAPRPKAIRSLPLSHQLRTSVPRATWWKATMFEITRQRCSQRHRFVKQVLSDVVPSAADGGPSSLLEYSYELITVGVP